MTRRGERGIWQRRYWEHMIHVGRDFAAHMDYTHFNHRGGGMRRAVRPYTWYTLLAAKISDDDDSGYTCWKPETVA